MVGSFSEEFQGLSYQRSHLKFVSEETLVLQISSKKEHDLKGISRIKFQWLWFYKGRQKVTPLLVGCVSPRENDINEAIHEVFKSFIRNMRKTIVAGEESKRIVERLSENIKDFCIPRVMLEELKKLKNDLPTQVMIITDDNSIPWELALANEETKNLSIGTLFIQEHGPFEPKLDFPPSILLILSPIQKKATDKAEVKDKGSKIRVEEIKQMLFDAFGLSKNQSDSVVILDETNISLREVKRNLMKKDFDFIYFLGHGVEISEGRFCLKITDSEYLTQEDIREITAWRRGRRIRLKKTPVVFLNACESVSGGYSAIADAFLDYGACAVIGTYWRILDEPAIRFSKLFFRELSEKKFATIGDALRTAKEYVCDEKWPLPEYAAYSLRGVPGVILPINGKEEGSIYFDNFLKYQLHRLSTQHPSIMLRGISVNVMESKSAIMPKSPRENANRLLKYLENETPTIVCVPVVTVADMLNLASEAKRAVRIAIVGVLFEPEPETMKFLVRKDEIGDCLKDILVHRSSLKKALFIGISGFHMVPTLLARYVLMKELGEKYKSGKEGAVIYRDLPQTALPGALRQRIVDSIVMYWPFLFELDESRCKFLEIDPISLYERDGGRVIGQLVITNQKHFEKHKETVEKMLGLLQNARDWSIDNAQEVASIQHDETGEPEDSIALSLQKVRKRDIAIRNDARKTSIANAISTFWSQALKIGGLDRIPDDRIADLIFCIPSKTTDEKEIEEPESSLQDLLDDPLGNIYKRLSEDKSLNELLLHIQNVHPNFTSHGPDHSRNIIRNLERIIPMKEWDKFSPLEVFLLLSSAWIHDIGMADFEGKIDFSDEKERKKKSKEFRDNHYERSQKYITDVNNYQRLGLISPIADLIGFICRAHDREYDIKQLKGKWGPIRGYEKYKKIRVQLLAALVRLADACDLGYQRVKEVLITVYDIPKNYFESVQHLEGAKLISNVVLKGKSLVVQATPQNDKQEEWVRFVKKDLEEDFLSVESILKDKENDIVIPIDDVIIDTLETKKRS